MKVRFLAVRGMRSTKPGVLAIVAGTVKVNWNPGGWHCSCPVWHAGADTCEHVEAVADLLDPRITGEDG